MAQTDRQETKKEFAIRRAETLREWAMNVLADSPDDADRILCEQILDLTEYVLFNQRSSY